MHLKLKSTQQTVQYPRSNVHGVRIVGLNPTHTCVNPVCTVGKTEYLICTVHGRGIPESTNIIFQELQLHYNNTKLLETIIELFFLL